MSTRSIPAPMAMRGRHVDERGQFSPEVIRFLDALRRALGGDAATTTQVVITRSTEAPVPVHGAPLMLPPVAISADVATAAAPVAVHMSTDTGAPVAVCLCLPETIPIPLM
jgi:hypothetical protein